MWIQTQHCDHKYLDLNHESDGNLQDHRYDGRQRSGLRLQSYTAIVESGGAYALLPGEPTPLNVGITLLGANEKVTSESPA